jgi:predicted lipoprotein
MRLFLVCAVALAPFAAAAQGPAIDHAALAERALNAHILPGFRALAAEAEALRAEVDAACSGAGPIEAGPVEAAYGRTFDAWARIGHVRFGPAEENNAGFAIAFWPDTKGSVPRTLATMVAAEDPVVDDPAAFAQVSVAARGLMAIDELLFDPEAEPVVAGRYRCRLLAAIAGDLVATTAGIVARWEDPWGGILTSAGSADNPVYLAPDESTRALYSALVDGLQADIDLRLGRPLGTFDRPQPRRAEAWRSGRSLPNVLASLEGMQAFAATVFGPAIGPEELAPVEDAFAAAFAAAGRVAAPIDVEVATPQGRIHVEALQGALRRVATEIASHFGPTIGVTSGFNALDGD